MSDYEVSGIENLARGVCVREGKVLLCRPRGGTYSYLPGGHIEFGETGAQALAREVEEELGLKAAVGDMIGVVESQFVQKGKKHAEISLVYKMDLNGLKDATNPQSRESWIEFVWWPTDKLHEANLLPPQMLNYVGV